MLRYKYKISQNRRSNIKGGYSLNDEMASCVIQPEMKQSVSAREPMTVMDLYSLADKERDRCRRSNQDREIYLARLRALYNEKSTRIKDDTILPPLRRQNRDSHEDLAMSQMRADDPEHRNQSVCEFVEPPIGGRSSTALSAPSNLCPRSHSPVNTEIKNLVGALSRHCCEVLGPKVCYQCSKVNRRSEDVSKSEQVYPNLYISEDNFASTVVVQKCLPQCSAYQIQTKLARGEIARGSFRDKLDKARMLKSRDGSSDENDRGQRRRRARSRAKSIAMTGATMNYFSNIRDLNNKICGGRIHRKLAPNTNDFGESEEQNDDLLLVSMPFNQRRPSFSETVCPTFVSPRKLPENKKPLMTLFEPPLLPVVCQNAEPSFFAGSDEPYQLPDRLPEVVIPEGEVKKLEEEAAKISLNVDDEVPQ